MRNTLLAIATAAAALGAPIAAQAQGYVTIGVPAPGVIVEHEPGIAVERVPAFRAYVVRERIPDYTIPAPVVVGTVLPPARVRFYDVPRSIAVTPYRYTVVNGETVLVNPYTRRVVQVIE
jgi:hypothetical protein